MSMLPVIEALQSRSDNTILVTTGTVTSSRRMTEVLPDGAVHQFVPVDTAGAVRDFLDHWQPDLAIWVESELWPRLVFDTHARGVPMAMVNARLSEKSAKGWARVPVMAQSLFGCFQMILAQDRETVARVSALGGKAEYTGNLKSLVKTKVADPAELATIRETIGERPVWLAASTHPGEDEIVLDAHDRISEETGAVLILAPRHPERGDDLLRMVSDKGYCVYRRSKGGVPMHEDEVLLADTMGEMGLWFDLAGATFVGGSLADHGGHTPFEPVQAGSAVLTGPHVANFAEAYAALEAAGAVEIVQDAEGIARHVLGLLSDPALRADKVCRAQAAHADLKPDEGAIADRLLNLMRTA
jgi:3-deoxy-D-manno-octulosonic-acid transferase